MSDQSTLPAQLLGASSLTPVHGERAHSLLGASGAKRWRKCAGSPNLISKYIKLMGNSTSSFAEEGTAMHELADWCLVEEMHPLQGVGKIFEPPKVMLDLAAVHAEHLSVALRLIHDGIKQDTVEFQRNAIEIRLPNARHQALEAAFAAIGAGEVPGAKLVQGVKITTELAYAVDEYVTHCLALYAAAGPGAVMLVEQQFTLEMLKPPKPMFGTNDLIIYSPTLRTLFVRDLKGGAGVVVDVEGNDQCWYYALGALLAHPEWQVDFIDIGIVQPRALQAGETIRTSRFPAIELVDFAMELIADAWKTIPDDAPRVAATSGDDNWCQFCPASPICPEAMMTNPPARTADRFPAAELMTMEEGERRVLLAPVVRSWLKRTEEHMLQRALNGEPLTLLKVTESLGHRAWVDEKLALEKALTVCADIDKIAPRQLLTPAQLESEIGKPAFKKFMAAFATRPSRGPALVPIRDERPARKGAADAFEAIDAPPGFVPPALPAPSSHGRRQRPEDAFGTVD